MIRDSLEIAKDVAREKLEVAQVVRKEVYDRKAVEREFETGALVWQ